ncbi:MAG: hypothetical protein HWQ36_26340 [Nostoc sp. NMS2]|uniref:hypothetical protein n=1 Tax=Nostoc sp. NMS2 TaxID=2815389 RepID=UPI0025E667AF|nr:hypothetical protein [Nostoc sp. NMS2]MBN3993908.1 hypothetical protein [Nostoc sp. NMS2]
MHVRKKNNCSDLVGSKKIVYLPNHEALHCLHILAAIKKETIASHNLNICKQWITFLTPSHFKVRQSTGKRQNPTNVYIDEELNEFLKNFGAMYLSNVLEKCLALEIQAQISRWGCQSPQHFIQLMTSDTPLELLGIDDMQVAA